MTSTFTLQYIFILLTISVLLSSCNNSKPQETPVVYNPQISKPDAPIIPKAENAYLGAIQFEKDDAITITLPDSTVIVAKQADATTRKYHLAKDTFLIFSTKNFQKGFKIYSNDNKALWQASLKKQGIEIKQEGFDKNIFQIVLHHNEITLRHKDKEMGKVYFENGKSVFKKNDKKLFEISSDKLLPSFGILLIEEIGVEERYALFAEALARGY